MEVFPFSKCDWSRVGDAARAVVNATLAEDAVVRASKLEDLRLVLTELRLKYGDHPVLLETEADFSDDPEERRVLYQAAIRRARRAKLATYSARMALARVLLDEFDDPDEALAELRACENELAAQADEAERQEWAELVARCGRRGGPPGTPTVNAHDRPWELPGAVRRDCEPHRADLLLLLGYVGAACCAAGLATAVFACGIPPFATGVLLTCTVAGIPCGLTGWLLARRDLRLMRAGLMDPAGMSGTERALALSRLAVGLCAAGWLLLEITAAVHLFAVRG
jgi:hypothetical protein